MYLMVGLDSKSVSGCGSPHHHALHCYLWGNPWILVSCIIWCRKFTGKMEAFVCKVFGLSLPVPHDRGKWLIYKCRRRDIGLKILAQVRNSEKPWEWSRAVVMLTATLMSRTQLWFLPHKTSDCQLRPSCCWSGFLWVLADGVWGGPLMF